MGYLMIAVAIFTTDYFIKQYIEKKKKLGKTETILKDNIIITKHHNHGAFLNLLEKQRDVLLVLSGVMMGAILILMLLFFPHKGRRLLKLAIAFLAGGAASNVYDRIKRGYVVDYFSFSWLRKVVFNISDLFIFTGSILFAALMFFKEEEL